LFCALALDLVMHIPSFVQAHPRTDFGSGNPREYGAPGGVSFTMAAGTTLQLLNLVNQNAYQRWKINLTVGIPRDVVTAPSTASFVTFTITSQMENDQSVRTVTLNVGDSITLYAQGRALTVTGATSALNTQPVRVDVGHDPHLPGVTRWSVMETVDAPVNPGTVALNVPPFCVGLEVFCPIGSPVPTLRAFDPAGTNRYSEALAVPRSAVIDRTPGRSYTLGSAGAATTYTVQYLCFG
jgi:hypothetical protein